jgi:hypothetical protein
MVFLCMSKKEFILESNNRIHIILPPCTLGFKNMWGGGENYTNTYGIFDIYKNFNVELQKKNFT